MPEQPEIHWLVYFGFVFGLILLGGIWGTIRARRLAKEERFTPTHRRTRERG